MDFLKRYIREKPLRAALIFLLACGVLVVIGNFAMNAQNSGM